MQKIVYRYAKREIKALKEVIKEEENLNCLDQILDTAILELEIVKRNKKILDLSKKRFRVHKMSQN